jgi:hypothetical protein
VYKLLQNHRRRITTQHRPSQTSKNEFKSSRDMIKNTRTSAVIVVGLILCYLPLVFMFAYYYTEPTNFMGIYLVSPWGEILLLTHSLFNPLYVFWRKSEFRHTARVLICQLKCLTRDLSNILGTDHSITNVAQRCSHQ